MEENIEKKQFKKCPFCAEEINYDAKKCKHCSSNLEVDNINSNSGDKINKPCPFCDEMISVNAKKCKFCGEIVDVTLRMVEDLKKTQSNDKGNIVISNSTTQQTTSTEQTPANNQSSSPIDPLLASLLVKPKKSRTVYILLGLFFGCLGIHNFYAGYIGRGICQLLLTLTVVLWFIPQIWAIIEIIVVTHDARNEIME